MLRWRLVSAAVLITSLVTLLWLDYHQVLFHRTGVWLLPVACGFLSLAVLEMFDLFHAQSWQPRRGMTLIGTLATVLSAVIPQLWTTYPANCPVGRLGWPMLAIGLSVTWIFVGEMARYREPGRTTVHVALSLLTILYLGGLGSFLVQLRLFHDNAWGLVALVSLIIVVKMCDTGAYFAGRFLGRHKMSPVLSPKKTIEGAVGGILASVLSAGIWLAWIVPTYLITDVPAIAPWRWAVYGLLLAVAGMIGDLAESLLKRDAGAKDASHRLPGMGGILDVLDSLLLAAPIAYACWVCGLIGPGG